MADINRQILLDQIPQGKLGREHFRLNEAALPKPGDGDLLLRGLMLNPDKTHVGDCRVEGQGFEFLGYRFEAGQRCVRKKSLKSVRDKIRAKTRRNEGRSLEYVIASLNPTLRGW